MATVGDGLIAIGIALIIFAIVSPVWMIEKYRESSTDYEICIKKCPSNFNGEFDNLECPKMCYEILYKNECIKQNEN